MEHSTHPTVYTANPSVQSLHNFDYEDLDMSVSIATGLTNVEREIYEAKTNIVDPPQDHQVHFHPDRAIDNIAMDEEELLWAEWRSRNTAISMYSEDSLGSRRKRRRTYTDENGMPGVMNVRMDV